jgi:hypothetical protein
MPLFRVSLFLAELRTLITVGAKCVEDRLGKLPHVETRSQVPRYSWRHEIRAIHDSAD